TGSTSQPFATNLHAAQLTSPLLAVLLEDLEAHGRRHPVPSLAPKAPPPPAVAAAPATAAPASAPPKADPRAAKPRLQTDEARRRQIFMGN
ncbi:MAG TPA: hypothetical protein PK264_03790, partial [Hyphomicrobiaceae bacterium]|nr:hypothetical protein [Hyphomicrobiaceae bacterium]